jgi:hypothetical protein
VTIGAESLPAGVSLEGGSHVVPLAPNETKNVPLRLLLNRAGAPGGSWDYGFSQPISLKATAPGNVTSSAYMTINIVEPLRTWEAQHTDLPVFYRLSYTIFANGEFRFHSEISNGALWPANCEFFFFLDGKQYAAFARHVGGVWGSEAVDFDSYGFVIQAFRDDYAHWIRAKGMFKATIKE